MTLYTLRYRGYSIHGTAAKPEVTYQAPAWPADPRIIKAPSLETAKRWIREEIWRKGRFPNGDHVYLLKTGGMPLFGPRVRHPVQWMIVDAKQQPLLEVWQKTAEQAREFAHSREWVLLEHFNY